MPRQPRVKKGVYCTYHVISRGVERKPIFRHDDDKIRFLDTLARMKEKLNYKIYGYCLMDNHIHLIIDSNGSDISIIMKSINVSYAMYFNRKYGRCGHLFQDRFRSEVVDDDIYLLELSRYIHLNPVRAKMVENAVDYPWSSYCFYIGLVENVKGLLDGALVLQQFSEDIKHARKQYIEYVSRDDESLHDKNSTYRIPIDYPDLEQEYLPAVRDADWVKNLIQEVARDNGVTVSEITKKRSPHNRARNLAMGEVRKNTNLSLLEIGHLFGGLSESAVSRILKDIGV